MPRKHRYQWQAETSVPEEPESISRSEKKRRCHALQKLGENLTRLSLTDMRTLHLPPELTAALEEYAHIHDHEGRRRQRQFIGRLMRETDIHHHILKKVQNISPLP